MNSSTPDELLVFPIIQEMENPQIFSEVMAAIAGFKNCKAAGPDGIPSEAYTFGERSLSEALLGYCLACWKVDDIPTN